MKPVNFGYVSYKGTFDCRTMIPEYITYEDNNPYHGEGWILSGQDLIKNETREYSFDDIIRGTVVATLTAIGDTVTDSKVDGIMNFIKGETI